MVGSGEGVPSTTKIATSERYDSPQTLFRAFTPSLGKVCNWWAGCGPPWKVCRVRRSRNTATRRPTLKNHLFHRFPHHHTPYRRAHCCMRPIHMHTEGCDHLTLQWRRLVRRTAPWNRFFSIGTVALHTNRKFHKPSRIHDWRVTARWKGERHL